MSDLTLSVKELRGVPKGEGSGLVTFYSPTPGATEFSDRATTDRGWVSANTSRYKGQASMFSTVA